MLYSFFKLQHLLSKLLPVIQISSQLQVASWPGMTEFVILRDSANCVKPFQNVICACDYITPTQIYEKSCEDKKPFKKGNSSSLCQSWLNSLYDLQKENYLLVFKHCICNEEFSFLWPLCCEFVYVYKYIWTSKKVSDVWIRYLVNFVQKFLPPHK